MARLFEKAQGHLSRRTVLGGLAAAAAFPRAVLAREASAAHRFAVGQFEITVLSDGTLTFPLSFAVPGHVPSEVKTLLESGGWPGDAITAQVNVSIVKTPDALILIDTGG